MAEPGAAHAVTRSPWRRRAGAVAVAGFLVTALGAAACSPSSGGGTASSAADRNRAGTGHLYDDATAAVGLRARAGTDPGRLGADSLGNSGQAWDDAGGATSLFLTDPVGPSSLVTTAAGGDGSTVSSPLQLVASVWTEDVNLPRRGGERSGFVDVNADGRPDLWATTGDGLVLFLARPDGGFAAADLGALGTVPATTAVAWGDFDDDGAVDVAVARSDPSRRTTLEVWRGDGTGRFVQAPPPPQPAGDVTVRGLGAFDCDGDGRRDLVGVRDGAPGFVLRAVGPATFADVAASGLDVAQNATGLHVGDLDGDGRIDVLASAAGPASGVRLFAATGDCRFTDRTDAAGLRLKASAGAAVAVDADADGAVDVVAAVGPARTVSANRMWRNDGAGHFAAVADAGGAGFAAAPGAGSASGLSVGGLDGRGRPDLLLGATGGPYRIYRNLATAHRITVRVAGPGAVGALVQVRDGDGHAHTGLAGSGAATGNGDSAQVMFGLGASDAIEAIIVRRGPGAAATVAGAGRADVAVTVGADGTATSTPLP